MRALLIDTSIQGALLGIADSADGVWTLRLESQTLIPQEAAASMPKLCSELLERGGLKIQDIDQILVGIGPGSFTGIKIGLSFVLGWKAAQSRLEIYGVSALRGLARLRKGPELYALAATQKAGYFAIHKDGQTLIGTADFQEPSPFLKHEGASVQVFDDFGPIRVLGSWPALEAWAAERKRGLQQEKLAELGSSLLMGMLEDFVANSERLSEGELRPLYLRKSAPEEKADKAGAAE